MSPATTATENKLYTAGLDVKLYQSLKRVYCWIGRKITSVTETYM